MTCPLAWKHYVNGSVYDCEGTCKSCECRKFSKAVECHCADKIWNYEDAEREMKNQGVVNPYCTKTSAATSSTPKPATKPSGCSCPILDLLTTGHRPGCSKL